jgi:hypothetical protein
MFGDDFAHPEAEKSYQYLENVMQGMKNQT